MEKLTSILTPCYNGEKYVWRLLDSVLNQTYPRIEMFIIDDGSTDNAKLLIQSYIPRFEAKGYSLTYVYQENLGQSVAINNGLKLISGDYLVWPDSDDFYATDDAILQMVNVLNQSDDSVSMVRCQSYLLDENTLKQIGRFSVNETTKRKTDLFEDCLLGLNSYWYVPGDYMAKTKKLKETILNMEIYTEKNAGQNWQLMLPLLYRNKCLTIEMFLYNILVRKESHSRGQYSTLEQLLQKYFSYENTLFNTIERIPKMSVAEKEKYRRQILLKYKKERFYLFLKYRKFNDAQHILSTLDNCPKNMLFYYYYSHIPLASFFQNIIVKFLSFIKCRI
jgi:glycosyltransferase involved in cell wall biosynthesis